MLTTGKRRQDGGMSGYPRVLASFKAPLHQDFHGDCSHRVVHIHAHADDAGSVLVTMPASVLTSQLKQISRRGTRWLECTQANSQAIDTAKTAATDDGSHLPLESCLHSLPLQRTILMQVSNAWTRRNQNRGDEAQVQDQAGTQGVKKLADAAER